MKYINKFETSEKLNNAKPQLQELEHYLAYDAENDKVYLKSPSYLIYVPIRESSEENNFPLFITNRCDLIKTLKIDGVEQDLSGKIREPHAFTATTEEGKISEIGNLINGKEGEKYVFYLSEFEKDKQYKVEIEWFDGITECIVAFGNCFELKSIPSDLFNKCKSITSFYLTFGYCKSLTSIPNNLFNECSAVTSFNSTFSGCTDLSEIGSYAFANCTNVTSFESMFSGLTSLSSIGDYAFANCTNVTSFESTFSGCTKLSTIGENIFSGCTEVKDFSKIFRECESLTSIPEKIFSENKKVTNFISTFERCYSLTVMPTDNDGEPIYNRHKDTGEGKEGYELVTYSEDCFCGCDSIDGAEFIPRNWRCVPK